MSGGDALWDEFVAAMLPLGPLHERGSRYGDKPALVINDKREIAHLEAPGIIDLRITAAGGGRRIERRNAATLTAPCRLAARPTGWAKYLPVIAYGRPERLVLLP